MISAQVAIALHLPVIIVLTHADLEVEDSVRQDAGDKLTALYNKAKSSTSSKDDDQNGEPQVFVVSNVTGEGYDALTAALSALPKGRRHHDDDRLFGFPRQPWTTTERKLPLSSSCPKKLTSPSMTNNKEMLVCIHDAFRSRRAGTVVGGTVHRGTVVAGDVVLFGPMGGTEDKAPTWRRVRIRSIRLEPNDEPAATCGPGQSAAFALGDDCHDVEKVSRRSGRAYFEIDSSRRRATGMVLVSALRSPPPATFYFRADLLVLCAPRRRGLGLDYESVVHAHTVRQSAKIIAMAGDFEELPAGRRAVCTFKFLFFAEFINPGTTIILRDGRTRAVGTVLPWNQQTSDDFRVTDPTEGVLGNPTASSVLVDNTPSTAVTTAAGSSGEDVGLVPPPRPKAVRCQT